MGTRRNTKKWKTQRMMDGVRRCITDLAPTEESTTYRRVWKKLFWGEGKQMHSEQILELKEMLRRGYCYYYYCHLHHHPYHHDGNNDDDDSSVKQR
jgi:hypothetical protein